MLQVDTPAGRMQVTIPQGLGPGATFEMMVPAQPIAQPVAQPVAQPAMQKMAVAVPPGMQGGMMLQVDTPAGRMQVTIPQGLGPGATFEMMVPAQQPTAADGLAGAMGGLSMAPAQPTLQQADSVPWAPGRTRVGTSMEGIRLSQAGSPGRSTTYQRFLGTPKELRSKGFTGRVRMICVALDYKGTPKPLGCKIDMERLSNVAKRAGCTDGVKLYDDGSTRLFPDPEGVEQAITEVGQRCGEHDYLVFAYSGHGGSRDNPDAPTGKDCVLCLRTRDGKDETLIDDEVADLITRFVPPKVRVLVLVDACHSGGILDMDTPGLWKGRRVCCISGCTEDQLSGDTGDGGVMTNALLKVLHKKSVKKRRKTRDLSVQFVFNRMVAEMPESEDDSDDYDDEDDSEDWEDDDEWGDDSDSDSWESDDTDSDEVDPTVGQHLTLSWPAGQDPSHITWPF